MLIFKSSKIYISSANVDMRRQAVIADLNHFRSTFFAGFIINIIFNYIRRKISIHFSIAAFFCSYMRINHSFWGLRQFAFFCFIIAQKAKLVVTINADFFRGFSVHIFYGKLQQICDTVQFVFKFLNFSCHCF